MSWFHMSPHISHRITPSFKSPFRGAGRLWHIGHIHFRDVTFLSSARAFSSLMWFYSIFAMARFQYNSHGGASIGTWWSDGLSLWDMNGTSKTTHLRACLGYDLGQVTCTFDKTYCVPTEFQSVPAKLRRCILKTFFLPPKSLQCREKTDK